VSRNIIRDEVWFACEDVLDDGAYESLSSRLGGKLLLVGDRTVRYGPLETRVYTQRVKLSMYVL